MPKKADGYNVMSFHLPGQLGHAEAPTGKIKKESAVDKLCAAMRQRILSGVWSTNEKIPTENELAEAFGLNRMTVRAAIQRMNALGIMETRVGDGTYVVPFNFTNLISEVSEFYTSSELVKETAVFRQIVEGGSYRLIIDNGTPEELEQLRVISAELSECLDRRIALEKQGEKVPDTLKNYSYSLIFRFHDQLFTMTHNKLLYYAHAISRDAVCRALCESGERRQIVFSQTGEWDNLKYHEKILEAIEEKNYEECRRRLTQYVSLETRYY